MDCSVATIFFFRLEYHDNVMKWGLSMFPSLCIMGDTQLNSSAACNRTLAPGWVLLSEAVLPLKVLVFMSLVLYTQAETS